ncbi:hypothetical protein FACS1894124_7520 [Spirochaetia bacterium]|nr:hypothetical protein FACS1894124_7520 [Spirochaetia bacterium]
MKKLPVHLLDRQVRKIAQEQAARQFDDTRIPWHPAFHLNAGPLKIDLLIIKKEPGVTIDKNFASIGKTVITDIAEGFDFPGWNFRKYNEALEHMG